MREISKFEIVTKMSYKNSPKKTSKEDKNLKAMNIPLKHNHHQLLPNHSIHTESEGQPSDRKLILSSKFSIWNLKIIRV